MRTINQVLRELQTSMTGLRINTGEAVTIEIWTPDGKIIGDTGRGVKITIPFRSIAPLKAGDKEE